MQKEQEQEEEEYIALPRISSRDVALTNLSEGAGGGG